MRRPEVLLLAGILVGAALWSRLQVAPGPLPEGPQAQAPSGVPPSPVSMASTPSGLTASPLSQRQFGGVVVDGVSRNPLAGARVEWLTLKGSAGELALGTRDTGASGAFEFQLWDHSRSLLREKVRISAPYFESRVVWLQPGVRERIVLQPACPID